jgi:hypothetical protein
MEMKGDRKMGRLRYQKQAKTPQKKKKRQRWGRREGGVQEEEEEYALYLQH